MSFDWKGTLATIAPTVATALGGPMAGMAVNVAAKALGIEPNAKALEQAIASGDPEILLKMREAENNLKLELKRLNVELVKAEVDDRKDARSMAKVLGMLPQLVLSVLFICGYFACAWAVFAHAIEIPDNMREMAGALMGIMTLAINTIIKFWFGMTAETKS